MVKPPDAACVVVVVVVVVAVAVAIAAAVAATASLPQLAFRRLSLRLQINILCSALHVAAVGVVVGGGSQCQAACM